MQANQLDPNIARRIACERRIVRRVVRDLLKAGLQIAVDNGGEELEVDFTTDFNRLIAGLFATDEEYLLVRRPPDETPDEKPRVAWVRLVYGNDGYDVVADYNSSLSWIIDPVIDWAGELEVR